MPAIEESDLSSYAVLWPCVGFDGYKNSILSFPPVEIPCRWKTGSRTTNPQVGTEDVLMIVSQDVAKGSVIWIGKLEDLPDPSLDPAFNQTEIYTVVDKKNTPDLRDVEMRRVLILQRSQAKIPVQ